MIIEILSLLGVISFGRELIYKQPNDPPKFIQDLETNTGLAFSLKCATCSVNGYVIGTTDTIRVMIFEDPTTDPVVDPIVFTSQLNTRLNIIVNRQTVKPVPALIPPVTKTPVVPVLPLLAPKL